MLGAVMSESTLQGMERLHHPRQLSNDKESESNYSNFKQKHMNMFSVGSSSNNLAKHSSLSPKVRKEETDSVNQAYTN